MNGLIKYTDIYSTTETLTGGYWINGKPIYRKVVTASNIGTSGNFSFAPAILNVDQIVKITGMVECNSGSYNGTQYLIPKDREEIVFNRTNGIMSLNNRNTSVNGDFVYSHTDEDFVIVDCDILDEVYNDMKNKKDLSYSVSDIKNVKDDIIETMELNDSQIDELNDFVKEVDSYVNGDKIEEKLRRL